MESSFEVTVRDFPELKDRTRILLHGKLPTGSSCLRCGDLAGMSWQASCGHSFCNECKDALTKGHVLTCPVHFVKTSKSSLKRTDRGIQETKQCTAGCAWGGCSESGSFDYILKHCEHCPKKPRMRRNWSWQSFDGEFEDNLHGGLVKIVKPHSPSSPKFETAHPLQFNVVPHASGV